MPPFTQNSEEPDREIQKALRILIADSHPFFREGLAAAIEKTAPSQCPGKRATRRWCAG